MKSKQFYKPRKGEIIDTTLPTFRVVGKRVRDSALMDVRQVHAINKEDAEFMCWTRYKMAVRYVIPEK